MRWYNWILTVIALGGAIGLAAPDIPLGFMISLIGMPIGLLIMLGAMLLLPLSVALAWQLMKGDQSPSAVLTGLALGAVSMVAFPPAIYLVLGLAKFGMSFTDYNHLTRGDDYDYIAFIDDSRFGVSTWVQYCDDFCLKVLASGTAKKIGFSNVESAVPEFRLRIGLVNYNLKEIPECDQQGLLVFFGYDPRTELRSASFADPIKLKKFGEKCTVRSGSNIDGVNIIFQYHEKLISNDIYHREDPFNKYVYMYNISTYMPEDDLFIGKAQLTNFASINIPFVIVPYISMGGSGGSFSASARLWKGQDMEPPPLDRFALVQSIIAGNR